MKEIIKNQNKLYKDNYLNNKNTPRGVFWNNKETQFLRFDILMQNILLHEKSRFSIHDIGSGLADLHKYLLDKNIDHVYSGTEIVQEMIESTINKYPYLNIKNRNLLDNSINEKYDYLVLSGTLNLKNTINELEWKKYIFDLISKMFEMANKGIVFNFLTTYKTLTDNTLFYLDPKEIFDFCMKNLSRFVTLNHSYPLYEGTITVFKEDFIKTKHNSEIYGKYFK